MKDADALATTRCRFCYARALRSAAVKDGYAFLECAACGFVFAPDVTPDLLAERYRDVQGLVAEGLPPGGWADTSFLAPAFERLPEGPLHILDFGTGESFLPEALSAEGHQVTGVDLAPPLRPQANRLTGPLSALPLQPQSFDLVFAYQVFEHLPHPRPDFDGLLRLVRDGGFLLIHTDMETEDRRRAPTLADWWYVMPPDHCAFYRHRTFAHVLAGTPHRIVHVDPKVVLVQVSA